LQKIAVTQGFQRFQKKLRFF